MQDKNMILELKHVMKRFGGITASNDISISVPGGEIYGIIGPNGAGKTTLFNMITGVYDTTEGEIYFNGEKINGMSTDAIATMGMSKTKIKNIATGENAVIFNAKRADIIIGSIGIVAANSMMGELTPAMANAISESSAVKVLIPLNKCGLRVAGVAADTLPSVMDDAVRIVKDVVDSKTKRC